MILADFKSLNYTFLFATVLHENPMGQNLHIFSFFHILSLFPVFLTVVPLRCICKCRCHYDYQLNYNVYNCSSTDIASLPEPSNLTEITDVLDLSRNRIPELCGKQTYLGTIAELDLSQNVVSKICEETVMIMKTGAITELNLSNNTITTLPFKTFKHLIVAKYQVVGKQFHL